MSGIICYVTLGASNPKDIGNLLAMLSHRGTNTHSESFFIENRMDVQGVREVAMGTCVDRRQALIEKMFSHRVLIDAVFPEDIALFSELDGDAIREHLKQGYQKLTMISGMVIVAIDSEGLTVWRSGDGQKAMYVGFKKDMIVFATEKKILWHENFDNIRPIEPFENLTVGWNGNLKSQMISAKNDAKKGITQQSALDLLAKFLEKSISKVIGKRTGILFSGGVDSALLAYLLNQHSEETILFSASAEESHDKTHTNKASRILGMDIKSVAMTPEEVWSSLPEIVYAAETCNRMDIEITLPFFLCSREAKKLGARYMVSGQGPDELFAGYARYVRMFESKGPRALEAQLRKDVAITHEANISRDERIIATHGLQAYFPYLDPKFTQVALSLPAEWKVSPNKTPERKVLFRHLAKRMGLPDIIANLPKKATQYSSGSSKAITKSISMNAGLKTGLSKKEIRVSCEEVLNDIARLVGIPVKSHESTESKYNLEAAHQFIKARGINHHQ